MGIRHEICRTHWEEPLHKKFNPDWDLQLFVSDKVDTDKENNIIVNKVFKFDDINEHIYKIFGRRINIENKSNKDDYILKEETERQIRTCL